MKFFKSTATVLLACLLTVAFVDLASAQAEEYRQAVQAFNKAREHAQNNEFEQAINMYNQAMSLAEKSGEQGEDIIERTRNLIPQIYYQLAVQKYKNFQKNKNLTSLNEAITAFQEASDVGSEYDQNSVMEKSGQIVTQLYYTRSVIEFKSQQYESALASLDQAINRNSNYVKAYYQKGLVVKNMDDGSLERALKFFDQAIEVGQNTNDNTTVRQAREKASGELIYHAVQAKDNRNYDRAVDLLNRALEYQESADAYYRLAEVHNKRTNWNQSIEYARQALELERGGRTEKAKIYFELGMALKAQGNKSQSCDAFSNAAYGSFKSPAEHQMEYELKCESSTR
ncbi:MAG: tetratricopeptide repeat protein [Balneolaceae bacterium]|nr:tetratricopeptide repeat protein [Balneolaceae bacterium]